MAENSPEEMGLGNNEQELLEHFFLSWSNSFAGMFTYK